MTLHDVLKDHAYSFKFLKNLFLQMKINFTKEIIKKKKTGRRIYHSDIVTIFSQALLFPDTERLVFQC